MKPIATPKYSGAISPPGRRKVALQDDSRAPGQGLDAPQALPYLSGYAPALQQQVRGWLKAGKAGQWLLDRHPEAHNRRTDKSLYDYVDALKNEHLRNAGLLHKVAYDSKIHVVRNALGLHTRRAIAHGGRLNARHEIHVASMFKQAPEAFLRMICVHELAHIREMDHDKAFYQLCTYMEPQYHQLEFEVRLYLTYLDTGAVALWGAVAASSD